MSDALVARSLLLGPPSDRREARRAKVGRLHEGGARGAEGVGEVGVARAAEARAVGRLLRRAGTHTLGEHAWPLSETPAMSGRGGVVLLAG